MNKNMSTLFLTSSIGSVIADITKHIPAEKRKMVFVTTASEAEQKERGWLVNDRKSLVGGGFDVTDYTFTGKDAATIRKDLGTYDLICVEGGNTYFLMQEIQRSGCAEVLKELTESGIIYIGSSAGSIVACPTIGWTGRLDDPDKAPNLVGRDGLGLVDFLVFPHWGRVDVAARHAQHNVPLLQKEPYPVILLSDSQYVLVEGDRCRIRDVADA